MLIVYGGSFNPPTIAHFEIANYLIHKYKPSQFVFVPVGDHYHKADLIPFYHRKQMVELITERLPKAMVSDLENEPTYQGTYHLLNQLKEKTKEPLYFVLGADNLFSIDRWIEYERLVSNFQFIVLERDGSDVTTFIHQHPFLNQYQHHFHIERDFPQLTISASMYRKEGRDDVVLKEVNEYIYNQQLYNRGDRYEK